MAILEGEGKRIGFGEAGERAWVWTGKSLFVLSFMTVQLVWVGGVTFAPAQSRLMRLTYSQD